MMFNKLFNETERAYISSGIEIQIRRAKDNIANLDINKFIEEHDEEYKKNISKEYSELMELRTKIKALREGLDTLVIQTML